MADLSIDTSLKITLDEIEKKIIQAETDRNNLETILLTKGIDIVHGSKMTDLINKTGTIKDVKYPNWYDFDGSNTWINCASYTMSSSIRYQCGAQYKNKIYFFHASGSVVYDTVSNTWETLKRIPVELVSPRATIVDNKIYVIGTYYTSYYDYPYLYCYDIETDTWSKKSDPPNQNKYPSIAAHCKSKKLYIIGGQDSGNNIGLGVQCYDIETDTWTLKIQNGGAMETTCITVKDLIYVMGGIDSVYGYHSNKNNCYDIESDTWISKTSIPKSSLNAGIVLIGNDIHLIGGNTDQNNNNTKAHHIYDTLSDSWRVGLSPNKTKIQVVCGKNKNHIYAITNDSSECYTL